MNINEKIRLAENALNAVSSCPEFKEAAKSFIDNPNDETEAALLAEAKDCISPIDGTVAFFETDMAKEIFGAEVAAQKLAHAKEIQAAGAVYCDCPGCTAAKDIIDNF